MYKNYFFLNRHIIELNEELKGYSLLEAFSQEKDTLVLSFRNNDSSRHLVVSASQNNPFILMKHDYGRSRKNNVGFFGQYLPSRLQRIEIAAGDRIIALRFDDFILYYFIRGKDTNVVLTDVNGEASTFRKVSPGNLPVILTALASAQYSPFFHRPFIQCGGMNLEDCKIHAAKNFPFIGHELLAEASARTASESSEEFAARIDEVLDTVETEKIDVFYDRTLGRMVMSSAGFSIYSPEDIKSFPAYNDALMDFISRRFRLAGKETIQRAISRNLDRLLGRTSAKLNEINGKLDKESREDEFRNIGNILLANISLIKKGMKSLLADDLYNDGRTIEIKLDEKLDAKGNTDLYFEKAKNERQSRIYLSELRKTLERKYEHLTELKNRFQSADGMDEYRSIMKELEIDDSTRGPEKKDESGFNFKHYIIDGKYHLYVGRDSRSNDNLTLRFAKQNDYWFHARGVPGSHAVLRVENTKEAMPKPVIKKAAAISAFHSKAKTSKMAPVAYTLKKYVTKRKGMEAGQVALLKEEVVMVQPAIPPDCQFVE